MITIAQAQALEPGDLIKHDYSSMPLIVTMVDKGGNDAVVVSLRADDGNKFAPKSFDQTELNKISIVSSRGAGEAAPPPPPEQALFLVKRGSPLFEAPTFNSIVKHSLIANITVPLLVTTVDEDWFMVLYKGEVGWVEAERGEVHGELFTVAVLPTEAEIEKAIAEREKAANKAAAAKVAKTTPEK